MNPLGIRQDVALHEMTSWKTGGAADFFCEPESQEQLTGCIQWALDQKHTVTVLGHGSNVLISDDGVPGLVVRMSRLNRLIRAEQKGKDFVLHCEAGMAKSEALKVFLKQQLAPAAFLAGLPGDIGGGVVMNAGVGTDTLPREFCEIVREVQVLRWTDQKLQLKTFTTDELEWSYRHSQGWQPGILTEVTLSWPFQPDPDVLQKVRAGNTRRKSTQPLNMPSCGSTFKNPEGHHAGALIEKAGLKGFTIGGAQVSEKHANFIVNTGVATSTEMHQVMQHVQKSVQDKFSVKLTNEVAYLGRWS